MKVFIERLSGRRGAIILSVALSVFTTACGASRAEYATGAMAPSGEAEYPREAPEAAQDEMLAESDHGMDYAASNSSLDWGEGERGSKSKKSWSESGAPAAKTGDGQAKTDSPDTDQVGTGLPRDTGASAEVGSPRKPMLLYEAHLGMAVFRTQENIDKIEQLAVKAGGYLVRRAASSIQVRVPAKDFESALREITALGDVHRKDIKAEDVTAEYTDTAIRLRNAQVVRERLEQLLVSAKNVEEALQVEQQLARVTEQIERMKGRLKLLSELAAFSTITVDFTERTSQVQTRVDLPFPWLDELGLHYLLHM